MSNQVNGESTLLKVVRMYKCIDKHLKDRGLEGCSPIWTANLLFLGNLYVFFSGKYAPKVSADLAPLQLIVVPWAYAHR